MFDTSPTVFYSYTGTMLPLHGITWHYVDNGSCPLPPVSQYNFTNIWNSKVKVKSQYSIKQHYKNI